MSSGLTIASTTAMLRGLLLGGLRRSDVAHQLGEDPDVTALAPERIVTGDRERAQLNIFLYRVTPHPAVPRVPSPTGARMLALELQYLVTAYGGRELHAEILLGHAIRILHEWPIVPRERVPEILQALPEPTGESGAHSAVAALRGCGLEAFPEQWHVIPDMLSNEDMMQLWTALQGKFRPSFTYKVVGAAIDAGVAPAGPRPAS